MSQWEAHTHTQYLDIFGVSKLPNYAEVQNFGVTYNQSEIVEEFR